MERNVNVIGAIRKLMGFVLRDDRDRVGVVRLMPIGTVQEYVYATRMAMSLLTMCVY